MTLDVRFLKIHLCLDIRKRAPCPHFMDIRIGRYMTEFGFEEPPPISNYRAFNAWSMTPLIPLSEKVLAQSPQPGHM